MGELDEVVAELEKELGSAFTQQHKDALYKLSPNPTHIRAALAMYGVAPMVLDSILQQVVEQAQKFIDAPGGAGGEANSMVSITTKGPAPITMEDLKRLMPQATKEATTFEKSPKWEPEVGTAILAKIKMVRKGSFELPLVIVSEYMMVTDDGNGPLTKGDLALPTYVVARCGGVNGGGLTDPQSGATKPGKFEEGKVYLIRVVGTKDTGKINPYVQVVTIGPLSDFPAK